MDSFLREREELEKLLSEIHRERPTESDSISEIDFLVVKIISKEVLRTQAEVFNLAEEMEVEGLKQGNS